MVCILLNYQGKNQKVNQILVRVHAATVNRADCGFLTGKPFFNRFLKGNDLKRCKAVIVREYSIVEIEDVYSYVLSGQKTGNVIVNF